MTYQKTEDEMRVLINSLAKQVRQSRAALIRTAIDDNLDRHHREQVEDGFGLWGKR
jgi:predicted transcriptional regulator